MRDTVTINLVHRKKGLVDLFVYGDEESSIELAHELLNLKDEEGKNLFREGLNGESYIPIKMMGEGRPDKRTPEYEEWIAPWLREIHETKTRNTEQLYKRIIKEEKEKVIDECIVELKKQYMEINPYSETDIAEAKGIQIAINILNHKKHNIRYEF